MAVEATTLVGSAKGTSVTAAIRRASEVTGARFGYFLATAKVESNLNPNAAAKTSSAGGLFQFIDRTWLGTLKEAGAQLGYSRYADAITRTNDGRYIVNDPAMRREIMALRQDPTANSLMAGVFTNSNTRHLTNKLGRAPTDGELYMAHFMGATGAARLITAAESNPGATAAAPADYGMLSLRVQGGAGGVLIDGERWQAPSNDDGVMLQLTTGRHVVEVEKEGYRRYITEVTVQKGETASVNVVLTKQ